MVGVDWNAESEGVMWTGQKHKGEKKDMIKVSLKPLCWKEVQSSQPPWAQGWWDTFVRMSPALKFLCQRKLWEGDCAWNSYEVSKRAWALESWRFIGLGTLSHSGGHTKVAHCNYFYQQQMKGELVLEFMNPLKCSQQPESLCCPCSTYFWVSRAVCAVPGWQIAVPWPGTGDVTSTFRPTCICMLASILFPI